MFKQIKAKNVALVTTYNQHLPLDFHTIHLLEDDFAILLELDEVYWKQRSREDWLK